MSDYLKRLNEIKEKENSVRSRDRKSEYSRLRYRTKKTERNKTDSYRAQNFSPERTYEVVSRVLTGLEKKEIKYDPQAGKLVKRGKQVTLILVILI